jgi:hypothetical protein
VAQPQGGVAGHRAFAGDDLADAIRRHGYLPRERRRRYAVLG